MRPRRARCFGATLAVYSDSKAPHRSCSLRMGPSIQPLGQHVKWHEWCTTLCYRLYAALLARLHANSVFEMKLRRDDCCATLRQGRGGSTGYDNAVALPGRSDAEELAKENNKSTKPLKGQAVFSVAKVHLRPLRCTHRNNWLLDCRLGNMLVLLHLANLHCPLLFAPHLVSG